MPPGVAASGETDRRVSPAGIARLKRGGWSVATPAPGQAAPDPSTDGASACVCPRPLTCRTSKRDQMAAWTAAAVRRRKSGTDELGVLETLAAAETRSKAAGGDEAAGASL